MIITTSRLTLMPMSVRYLEAVNTYCTDPENTRLMSNMPNENISETAKYLAEAEKQWHSPDQVLYQFAITLDGNVMGSIGLSIDDTPEFGWIIDKRYHGRGYCTEAALALVDLAKKLGVERVIAHCDAENIASSRVMEKIGMKQISRAGGRHNRLHPEEERDELIYELVIDGRDI